MTVIDRSKYEEMSLQAKLHGLKMKPRNEPLKLTKEERKEADDMAMDLLKRMNAQVKT